MGASGGSQDFSVLYFLYYNASYYCSICESINSERIFKILYYATTGEKLSGTNLEVECTAAHQLTVRAKNGYYLYNINDIYDTGDYFTSYGQNGTAVFSAAHQANRTLIATKEPITVVS